MFLNILSNPALNVSEVFLKIREISCNNKAIVRREMEFLVSKFERCMLLVFYFKFNTKAFSHKQTLQVYF